MQENDIRVLVNIIDWAIMDGYNTEKHKNIIPLFEKMIKEIDANKESDNYFKETYGIE